MNQLAHIPKDDEVICKMLNLARPSKDKHTVGRFKYDSRCKKHPKHRQSPGVCSLCLREKLNLLSTSTSRKTPSLAAATSTSSSVSSLSSYYSSSASSCASPMHPFPFTKEGKSSSSSISIFLFNGKHGLIKSRSMAVIPRRRDADGGTVNYKSTKKGGFFFKLLRPRSKRMEEKDTNKLAHSSSVRENVVTMASS